MCLHVIYWAFFGVFFLSYSSFVEIVQASHTSVELPGNASEGHVSLQEIGNKFEIIPWGRKKERLNR